MGQNWPTATGRPAVNDGPTRVKPRERGGDRRRVDLLDLPADSEPADDRILSLDAALIRLAAEDPEAARVVELRHCAGLLIEDATTALSVSRATAYRQWTYARAWLRDALTEDPHRSIFPESCETFGVDSHIVGRPPPGVPTAMDRTRAKEISLAAAELDAAARATYLDTTCGADAGLRARVAALLRAHDEAGSFLGTPAAAVPERDHAATRAVHSGRPLGSGCRSGPHPWRVESAGLN